MNADTAGRRYRAFISYSHSDADAARWLHRRLEAFVMPAHLVGQPGPHGPITPRLAPIFRDREDLPAAHDLTEEVLAALAASACLVVIASPAAAASRYVAQEIALFRAQHPDRPILVALWDGEPDEAFPPALRIADNGAMVEPLAADFRKQGDGRRLALLKLIAGIAGVDLDALVQREAQRRLRRVTVVTVAAIIGMIGMGLLAAFAFSARAEADRQRSEAEGLVEFMLTDLRDRLKGVGRLDVLTSANKRALSYYQGADLAGLGVDSIERRARILQAMGEDEELRGDLPAASALFAEAARTTSALVVASPADPARVFTHAQTIYWQGLVAWRRGDAAAAAKAWRQYADLAADLRRIEPEKPEWIMEAGYAASNLGTLALRAQGDAKAAEAYFNQSRGLFAKAAALMPDDSDPLRDIADADAWIADCRRATGDWPGALSARARQAETLERLRRKDPQNAQNRIDRLRSQLGAARVEIDAGCAGKALARIEAARPELSAIDDPDNRDVALMQTMFDLVTAEAKLASGRPDAVDLAACATPAMVHDSREIDAFCRLLAARKFRRLGNPKAAQAALALAIARAPDSGSTPSTRWNIDFKREINSVTEQP